jgi:hypothetical protein
MRETNVKIIFSAKMGTCVNCVLVTEELKMFRINQMFAAIVVY